MEGNLQGGLATIHVKAEAVDENTFAPVLSSWGPPACRGGGAGGGGGGGGGEDQAADELYDTELQEAAATTSPALLYPVSTDRFFTTSAGGKTNLRIDPGSVMTTAPSDTLPIGSDFSPKAIFCLIKAVGRRWGAFDTRERSQLFQGVQEEMATNGHVHTAEKIRRKWNNLILTYKRVKDRSLETRHAKTSWEFFDLMDATLGDTVGTQVVNNKRKKAGSTASTLSCSLPKIAAKSQLPQLTTYVRSNGDLCALESAGQGASGGLLIASTSSAMTSVASAPNNPTNIPDVKPLILNGAVVSNSIHAATVVPSPSFVSSPSFRETASTSPSLGSSGSTDLSTSRFAGRKAPSSSGVAPLRLSAAQVGNSPNLLGLWSSFPPMTSRLTSPAATSLPATSMSGGEAQSHTGNEEQSGSALLGEFLKRQEEQAYLDRAARRRVGAREKRRERREVRMAQSMGRIATALELLSSKQDTVIAVLQRLADRK